MGADADAPFIGGEFADPDRDGIPNLMEYALNLDPNAHPPVSFPPGHAALPTVVEVGMDLALIYRKNLSATDLSYTVEESDDLGEGDPWAPAAVTETILDDDGQTQVIRATLPPSQNSRQFVRLKMAK